MNMRTLGLLGPKLILIQSLWRSSWSNCMDRRQGQCNDRVWVLSFPLCLSGTALCAQLRSRRSELRVLQEWATHGQGSALQVASLPEPRRSWRLLCRRLIPSEGQREHAPERALSPPFLCSQYFKYEFPDGVDSVIVKVTSKKAFPCSVISIQDVLVSCLSFYLPPESNWDIIKRGQSPVPYPSASSFLLL